MGEFLKIMGKSILKLCDVLADNPILGIPVLGCLMVAFFPLGFILLIITVYKYTMKRG